MTDRGEQNIDSQEKAWPQQFVIGNDEAELELSVESRSFVNRVNDQVAKKTEKNLMLQKKEKKHSVIWGIFTAVTMESAVFMGKNYPEQLALHCEHNRWPGGGIPKAGL